MLAGSGRLDRIEESALFELIETDVAGPFPVSNGGNRYVLVVMDYFSKWPEVCAYLIKRRTQ